jgi:hypothetical protein
LLGKAARMYEAKRANKSRARSANGPAVTPCPPSPVRVHGGFVAAVPSMYPEAQR